jgi:phage tail sheath protein FI
MHALEPHPIGAASTSVTAFVGRTRRGPLDRAVPVNSMAEFDAEFGGLWQGSPLSFAVQQYFENGGHVAIIARVATGDADDHTAGGPIGDAELVRSDGVAGRRGLYLLESWGNFDLLVIPPFAWDHNPAPSIWAAAATYCLRRRAFLLIDPPMGSATGTAETEVAAIVKAVPPGSEAAANAACYVPRLVASNELTQRTQLFAPAAAIAGVMARIDSTAGVWTAPAGDAAAIRGATGLERDLTSGEMAALTSLGVNCLRNIPAVGSVVWGARTLHGAAGHSTDWKYIPVRRLALFLEKSIDQGTRWAVFERNDEPAWARIRLDVSAFLQWLFRRGAFQGESPGEAYFVRCGADTTTQHDIDQGIVNIQVGFAPIRPAEFVILSIKQLAGQSPD